MSESSGGELPPTALIFSGRGTVHVQPDRVELGLTVVVRDSRRERAYAQLSEGSQRLGRLLDSLQVPERSRRTSGISLHQTVDAKGRPDGYRAQTTVRLRLPVGFPLPSLLARAVEEAGAEVEGPTWDVSRQHPGRLEAVQRAVLDARARASAAAEVLGLRVGAPIEVREVSSTPSPMVRKRAVLGPAVAASAGLDVEAGEISISAEVEINFNGLRTPLS